MRATKGKDAMIEPTDVIGEDVRLYCGDALAVLPTIEDESVQLICTDPPYGMLYQSARRIDKASRFPEIANDDQPYIWWLRDAARVLVPGGCLVCFCRWDSAEAFRLAIGWAGLRIVSQLVWDRVVHGMGDLTGSPAPQHDTIWFATKGKYSLPKSRPSSVYRQQRIGGEELQHPNEKPVALMRRLIADYAAPSGRVLDAFMGSGTTGVACQQTGNPFVGVELDPTHYATALRRLTHATGSGPGQLFGNLVETAS